MYNILTGEKINQTDGNAESSFKKMCINCKHCAMHESVISVDGEAEVYECNNKEVLAKNEAKILETIPDGYNVEVLRLKSIRLKNPTTKCPNHELLDSDVIMGQVLDLLSKQ